MNAVEIFEAADGQTQLTVSLEKDTVWLSQEQMTLLFDVQKAAISKHLKNIYTSGELDREATVSKMETVQNEGGRDVVRQIEFFNLDAVISVGYRVNSRRATQFRQWATRTLKEHLVRGYTLNEKRLRAQQENIRQLEHTLTLFQKTLIEQASLSEARGLAQVIADYAQTFVLLNQFDSERLPVDGFKSDLQFEIAFEPACAAVALLKADLLARGEASDLFGRMKDDSFAGVLGNVTQSFGGEYLYPSIESQAAHLLYFVIKNHPFTDGNKRIGAFLFIWFLTLNTHHLKSDGELKINDNALAAIALLVAQSDPLQKELMIHLIMNLIRN